MVIFHSYVSLPEGISGKDMVIYIYISISYIIYIYIYSFSRKSICQWELQDPKMEVLYYIKPTFSGDIILHRPDK